MKVSNYASTYLNASDLDGPTVVTISNCQEERIGTNEKLALYVEEMDQAIPLGKTTIAQLIQILGSEESDEWIGRKVIVFNDKSVMFQNRRVGGIRFRSADSSEVATPAKAGKASGKGKGSDVDFPGH